MYHLILCFITSFLVTYIAIPSIITIAKVKKLVDEPEERRAHTKSIPTLGGIAIFAGVIFSLILWTPFQIFGDLQYILCAMVILFLIGAKDDIIPLDPYKKFVGQIFAASILVFKANIQITSFYGIFGLFELPEWVSILISMFTILVIINSMNLIDGVNALCASVGLIICVTLGYWFKSIDQNVYAIISSALVGSLVAFMKFNISPARIFMGDTGSMLVGVICSILTIGFIESNKNVLNPEYHIHAAPAIAIAVLFIPLFDMIRIFFIRIIKGRSPFQADRQHLHHLLLDLGFTHLQVTTILILINTFIIAITYKLQFLGNINLLWIILLTGIFITSLIHYLRNKKLIDIP
ncbi:MAG: undecaprenyl/decaprenyl-phosphate alpha-N-acetylglucosaminyl 1-phosphate transferase [Saprospiraceae bacterium]|nr:undecaprenyl/decaprenyl-phosphate alpha-N-acetylglucosaminyl 1-phosphate transferase [Saprospiraceae bacterium]